jgi:hypothetical protein
MKTFNLSETQTVKTNFEAYFGASFGQFYDGFMSVLTKTIKIDLIKFDNYLHKKYGQYENEGLSMNTAIVKYYGEPAKNFIESLV